MLRLAPPPGTCPAWLDLPGAQGFRRNSSCDRQSTQATPQWQGACTNGEMLDDQALPSTETFTYPGSVVRQAGDTNKAIQSRLSKARNVSRSLNAVWRS